MGAAPRASDGGVAPSASAGGATPFTSAIAAVVSGMAGSATTSALAELAASSESSTACSPIASCRASASALGSPPGPASGATSTSTRTSAATSAARGVSLYEPRLESGMRALKERRERAAASAVEVGGCRSAAGLVDVLLLATRLKLAEVEGALRVEHEREEVLFRRPTVGDGLALCGLSDLVITPIHLLFLLLLLIGRPVGAGVRTLLALAKTDFGALHCRLGAILAAAFGRRLHICRPLTDTIVLSVQRPLRPAHGEDAVLVVGLGDGCATSKHGHGACQPAPA
eukprot:scaffold43556_cov22-Tisochrysis_lutea.AAC.1